MKQLTLIFDGYCGFCTRSVNLLKKIDKHHRIEYIPYQNARASEEYGINPDRGAKSVWSITPQGETLGAAAAVNRAIDIAIGRKIFERIYRLPLIGSIQEAVYRWIARNRRHFPGVTPYCKDNPNQCDRGKENML